jgi:hypothetical protein
MPKKTEFHTVDFFRKIRDQQAAALSGKSSAEIVAFFSKTGSSRPAKHTGLPHRHAMRP